MDCGYVLGDDSILNQVRRVKGLHARYGVSLASAEDVRLRVQEFRATIEETAAVMSGEGIEAACSSCALKYPSGCCFSGIESGFDDMLLLLNLLLGCPLPEERHQQGSCFFVGEHGCRLLARYYFCLHYFCPELESALGESRIRALRQRVDRQLHAGRKAEDAVRSWLRARTPAGREDAFR